jgi:hypothetical protein
MVFEQAELRGASITTKATIARGRSAITLGLDAPLTIEAAAALGCKEKLFTTDGEIRPDLFSTACFRLPVERLAVALELDGIAKRQVRAPEAQAGNITIELGEEEIRLKLALVIRGPSRTQLALLGFAMEVGTAPLVCRISAKTSQNGLGE